MIRIEHENEGKKGRFVLFENDEQAGELTYRRVGKTKFIIDHTGVDEKFGGKGFGYQLVMESVEYARKNNLKIIPLCPFAKRVFDKNESLQDVRS